MENTVLKQIVRTKTKIIQISLINKCILLKLKQSKVNDLNFWNNFKIANSNFYELYI